MKYQQEGIHTVPVHILLPLVGSSAALVLALFTVVVVLIPPGPSSNGSLKYISVGMQQHCGWSGLVLGTAGSLVGICDLVPAIHVGRTDVILCLMAQLVCWNIVLGISETGWPLHYAGLSVFCFSNVYFNYVMSRSSHYGTDFYQRVQGLSAFFILIFAVSFAVVNAMGGEGMRMALDVTVCIEFLLMTSVTANTLCLMQSLNNYSSIHLIFSRVESAWPPQEIVHA
jgi:hypothetical protein